MPVAKPVISEGRVIAHLDMDCFYVQVEQRKQPQLRGLPTAVVQYNEWKGGALIAVSYEARRNGVKRSMRGDEAKNVCPEIQLVQVPVARGKADLSTYRNAGSEVVSILARKGRCERASIDEVYLDLTDAAEIMLAETPPESLENVDEESLNSHIIGIDEGGNDVKENVRNWLQRSDADHQDKLLSCGALIVAELRRKVLEETEFTCSAGIAHNKMLAKLASGLNKPAQQTVVPSSAVKDFLAPWPIKKMKQLGGKLGDSLQNDLGIKTVGELLQFSNQRLHDRYGINTGTWLWNIARGISGEEVQGRVLPKSHGSGKTFPGPRALRSVETVAHWLEQLCEELSERLLVDLDQNKRVATTLTLHVRAYKSSDTDSQKKFPSKSCPLRYGASKVKEDAQTLFRAGLREFIGAYGVKGNREKNSGWAVTGLSVSASKIMDVPKGTCTITKFFGSQYAVCPALSEGTTTSDFPGSDGNLTPSVATEREENTVREPAFDLGQNEGDETCQKEQITSCSLLDQGNFEETAHIAKPESECCLDVNQDEPQLKFCGNKVGSLPANLHLKLEGQPTKGSNIKGKSSILRYLVRSDHSCSLLKHEDKANFETNIPTSSDISECGSVQQTRQTLGKREIWSYNVHEVDPSIIKELPPEIQEELRGWMRPLKQSVSAKRNNIASYFSPTRRSS